MITFFGIVSIILVIAYVFFIYKVRYLNENTLKNNIITESIGAALMLIIMIGALFKGITWLAISSGIVLLFDVCMVIYYIVTKKTLR